MSWVRRHMLSMAWSSWSEGILPALDIYSRSKSCKAWRTLFPAATILSLLSSRVQLKNSKNSLNDWEYRTEHCDLTRKIARNCRAFKTAQVAANCEQKNTCKKNYRSLDIVAGPGELCTTAPRYPPQLGYLSPDQEKLTKSKLIHPSRPLLFRSNLINLKLLAHYLYIIGNIRHLCAFMGILSPLFICSEVIS